MARKSGRNGPKEQFGARVERPIKDFVISKARSERREPSDALRLIIEAGAYQLRDLGSFAALAAWLGKHAPFGSPPIGSPRRAVSTSGRSGTASN